MSNEILEIKKYPDSVLRKRAKEIGKITGEIKRLGVNMIAAMVADSGVGLAANQVGILKRIIVVQMGDKPQVFINPVITRAGREKEFMTEGCLSVSGLCLDVKRFVEIEVTALDINGQQLHFKAKDFIARIFQHEIDHLNGVLIIDRVGFWQGLKAKRELKKNR